MTTLPSSRAEALIAGVKRYFTGKTCKHGHVAQRSTSTGGCVLCQRTWHEARRTPEYEARMAAWRARPQVKAHYAHLNAAWRVGNQAYKARQVENMRRLRATGDSTILLRDRARRMVNRLRCSVTNGKMKRLGYSAAAWKAHLASTLPLGVTIETSLAKGSGWSIDHVVPVSVIAHLDAPDEAKLMIAMDLENQRMMPLRANCARGEGSPDEYHDLLRRLVHRHAQPPSGL